MLIIDGRKTYQNVSAFIFPHTVSHGIYRPGALGIEGGGEEQREKR